MNFIQQLINGLSIGSVYALVALGYTMVYGIVKLINFAHGDFIMVGAYVSVLSVPFLIGIGVPVWLCIIPAVIICSIIGMLSDQIAYKPLRNPEKINALLANIKIFTLKLCGVPKEKIVIKSSRNIPRISALITAIGVSLLLENLAMLIFSPTPKSFPTVFPGENIPLFGLRISVPAIVTILAGIAVMILLNLFIRYTKIGKAMRAVSEDAGAASLVGININTTITVTFAIGSGLAALAAVLYCASYPLVEPYMGTMLGLKAFVAAVLGGIGSVPGAMFGGLILGVVESLTKSYISTQYSDAVVFGILILVLIFKPSGLFGKNSREKV